MNFNDSAGKPLTKIYTTINRIGRIASSVISINIPKPTFWTMLRRDEVALKPG
jgi:hypothetical protein